MAQGIPKEQNYKKHSKRHKEMLHSMFHPTHKGKTIAIYLHHDT
jgi:hypothetical protein